MIDEDDDDFSAGDRRHALIPDYARTITFMLLVILGIPMHASAVVGDSDALLVTVAGVSQSESDPCDSPFNARVSFGCDFEIIPHFSRADSEIQQTAVIIEEYELLQFASRPTLRRDYLLMDQSTLEYLISKALAKAKSLYPGSNCRVVSAYGCTSFRKIPIHVVLLDTLEVIDVMHGFSRFRAALLKRNQQQKQNLRSFSEKRPKRQTPPEQHQRNVDLLTAIMQSLFGTSVTISVQTEGPPAAAEHIILS